MDRSSTRTWQRPSARVLRAWRGERGSWCPGYERGAHQASDLTVDHVGPLAAGGAPFDSGNRTRDFDLHHPIEGRDESLVAAGLRA